MRISPHPIEAVIPQPTLGVFFVQSATRSKLFHRVSVFPTGITRCTCEAGRRGMNCWHVEAVKDYMLNLMDADKIVAGARTFWARRGLVEITTMTITQTVSVTTEPLDPFEGL